MRDKEVNRQILRVGSLWKVAEVELALAAGEVKIYVEQELGTDLKCPQCGSICPGYDERRRQWRHLDTCQYKTIVIADVPRIECREHGVLTVEVPWAEPGCGYTAMFEALVIDWLKEALIQAVSRQKKVSWNAIDGIMRRAVRRGLEATTAEATADRDK